MDQTPAKSRVSPFYSLRAKLTLTLLFASLMAALAVGGTAYWLLMRDFNATVRADAFEYFKADVQAYVSQYGSWEKAQQAESFDEFEARRHSGNGVPGSEGGPSQGQVHPPGAPSFHFLLLDPGGHVMNSESGFRLGHAVSDEVLRQAHPITVNGQVVVLAVPRGTPRLSARDQAYVDIMRKALLGGMMAASALAIIMGLLLGSRFGARVRELISAIQSMGTNGNMLQQVPVHTNDEMGVLARAFNRMSSELSLAHSELKKTARQVQLQAEQLKELSIRDPLTQMFNRRYFDEQAGLLLRQALRNGRPFSVMVGDLDHFKSINDNFSHAVGDEVLRRVAAVIGENTRHTDIVARYGGEEFVIAFVESTAEQALQRCEALRGAIERYPWQEIHLNLRVTMSMGVSDDTSQGNVEKMLAVADAGLYEAKRSGRNRIVRVPA
jgi:diguanylate cyclase (GGDEF)-like protein